MTKTDILRLVRAREALQTGQAVELRKSCGLTQAEIAAAVGVTASAICHWETGNRLPRGEAAKRYARLIEALNRSRAAPV